MTTALYYQSLSVSQYPQASPYRVVVSDGSRYPGREAFRVQVIGLSHRNPGVEGSGSPVAIRGLSRLLAKFYGRERRLLSYWNLR